VALHTFQLDLRQLPLNPVCLDHGFSPDDLLLHEVFHLLGNRVLVVFVLGLFYNLLLLSLDLVRKGVVVFDFEPVNLLVAVRNLCFVQPEQLNEFSVSGSLNQLPPEPVVLFHDFLKLSSGQLQDLAVTERGVRCLERAASQQFILRKNCALDQNVRRNLKLALRR
jgi:hypothetical protein